MNKLTLLVCAAAVLLGSAAVEAAQSPTASHVHPFDLPRSKMTVYVSKEGLFAFAGDDHQVDVPIASGSYDDATGSVELTVESKELRVLDPPSRRDKVQANMVGPQVLDAERYRTIAFRSTTIEGSASDRWTVVGDLTLHGQTRPVTLQVSKIDTTHFRGMTSITQSAFGITPLRVAGGIVRVKDKLRVEFEIVLL